MNIPGPRSRALAARLAARESRNLTHLDGGCAIFWELATGATVIDVDGNHYIDCTAAFGVANAGHANAAVAQAIAQQAGLLAHGMGDVHPTEIRVKLLERLVALAPKGLEKAFLASTGSEAVEAALKTAILATGKSRFAAFAGGYHGLSFGALAVGGIERFRTPFAGALPAEPLLLPFPVAGSDDLAGATAQSEELLAGRSDLAAVIVEPIQGRAGAVVPPAGYLRALRALCDELGILLIADEIYTGFGRTGRWFASEGDGIVPDILCVGKALANGFPLSAAIGRGAVMDAWPPSTGEALHTSTFLGHPIGCAAALATIGEHERMGLAQRAERLGRLVARRLAALRSHAAVESVRGEGLLQALVLRDGTEAGRVVARALREGAIFLQSGVRGEAITIAPPLTIEEPELSRALTILEDALAEAA